VGTLNECQWGDKPLGLTIAPQTLGVWYRPPGNTDESHARCKDRKFNDPKASIAALFAPCPTRITSRRLASPT
jgi:hypothetical protein